MERNMLIDLVTRAQKGDSTAMDELFSAFYNDVYYFALKTLKDSDTACDITQETFLEIISTIDQLQEPAAFVTWMKQITYHQCTRYFKKKKEVLVEEDEDGNTIFDTLADEREGSIPSEVCEKEDFRNTILGIINELTEEQRSAVILYYFDELTVSQIAQIQGVSEGTVKSRLNYARKAIKKSVESYEKKHNIKLHSVTILPLLLLCFSKELMPADKAEKVQKAVSQTSGGGASASASKGRGGKVAAGKAAAGTGFGAKIAALPLAVKVFAGALAACILIGGGVAALVGAGRNEEDTHAGQTPTEQTAEPTQDSNPHTDTNADGYCDHCAQPMCTLAQAEHRIPAEGCLCVLCGEGGHVEGDVHPFCGVCSERLPIDDRDGDGACDICGEYSCGGTYHGGQNHTDDDNDGKCDICQKYMCGLIWGLEHFVDYSDGIYDGKCDHCGQNTEGAMGWGDDGLPHADGDSDGICDCCNWEVCRVYGMPEFGGVDEDGDGKCDICQWHLCMNHSYHYYHYDFDQDEKCDRCDRYICAFGFLPHIDENGDEICDKCFSGLWN